ncbi:MAG: hypothetical protein HXY50_00740 [Ignavibacteriaceae bacterium]|nr:hypothetical protein [Ignavibacteriaceae bacterium]
MKRIKSILFVVSLLILTMIGCFDMPEEIILPEWDVELNVPIIDRTYTLYDMFKPESKHSINSTLSPDDFYLVQTDNFTSNTDVAKYIDFLETTSISQNLIIPANVPATAIYIEFPEQLEIDRAVFSSGILSISFQNPTSAAITSQLRVPGITKPDGSELIIERSVPAFSQDSVNYDLTNHSYNIPTNQPVQNRNSLQFVASANSVMNGSYESLNVYLNNLKFQSITGSVPKLTMGRKRTSASLNINDAADYRGKLFIKEATLNLKSEYISAHNNPFEMEIADINLIGLRKNGEKIQLEKKDGQAITFKLVSGVYNLVLNETNSNITEFMTWLPDSIVIESEYIINPADDHVIRTISNEDLVEFSAQFSTKSIFAIKQTNFTDTLDIDFSSDDRDKIKDGVGAELSIHLENAIPINAFIKVTVTDANYLPLFTLTHSQSGVDSLQFLGGQVNTSTGEVISPVITLNSVSLSGAQIQQLANAHHLILSATVSTSSSNESVPTTVQFKSSDWLRVKSYGKVKYHINPEEK